MANDNDDYKKLDVVDNWKEKLLTKYQDGAIAGIRTIAGLLADLPADMRSFFIEINSLVIVALHAVVPIDEDGDMKFSPRQLVEFMGEHVSELADAREEIINLIIESSPVASKTKNFSTDDIKCKAVYVEPKNAGKKAN